jgi:hypothetical protein
MSNKPPKIAEPISNETDKKSTVPSRGRFIVIHGDKGGVGKSFVAQAIVDLLFENGVKVAIVDADTANPDVSRMFADSVPCIQANIRGENGWMDVMDFVSKHPGHTIVMNTPAGVGEHMRRDITSFAGFLAAQDTPLDLELWWAMNVQHDSVNLFDKAFREYGVLFSRVRIICNTHFSNGDKSDQGPFFLWNESPLRTRIEKNGGLTLCFPALNLRVVKKLFEPVHVMPFYMAVDAASGEEVGLSSSERWKLVQWRTDVAALLRPALSISVVNE